MFGRKRRVNICTQFECGVFKKKTQKENMTLFKPFGATLTGKDTTDFKLLYFTVATTVAL